MPLLALDQGDDSVLDPALIGAAREFLLDATQDVPADFLAGPVPCIAENLRGSAPTQVSARVPAPTRVSGDPRRVVIFSWPVCDSFRYAENLLLQVPAAFSAVRESYAIEVPSPSASTSTYLTQITPGGGLGITELCLFSRHAGIGAEPISDTDKGDDSVFDHTLVYATRKASLDACQSASRSASRSASFTYPTSSTSSTSPSQCASCLQWLPPPEVSFCNIRPTDRLSSDLRSIFVQLQDPRRVVLLFQIPADGFHRVAGMEECARGSSTPGAGICRDGGWQTVRAL